MMANIPSPKDYLIDPLSLVARKERRNLLVVSSIVLLVVHAGLIPTKISALGIELQPSAQASFMLFLIFVVVYFLLAFVVYGFSDFLLWRHKYQDHLERFQQYSQDWSQEDQELYDELRLVVPDADWVHRLSRPIAWVRIIFEFGLPIVIAIYSIFSSFEFWKTVV